MKNPELVRCSLSPGVDWRVCAEQVLVLHAISSLFAFRLVYNFVGITVGFAAGKPECNVCAVVLQAKKSPRCAGAGWAAATAMGVAGDQPRAAGVVTATAVILSTRRTVAAGVRMWAVRAVPIRIGPTVTPPLVVVLSTL
jgi:hypothetical protein